jgi:hypothetical protein
LPSRCSPAVEALLDDERIDFVQTNYSLAERQAADRLLPKAMERGVARGRLPDAALRRRMEQYVDSL